MKTKITFLFLVFLSFLGYAQQELPDALVSLYAKPANTKITMQATVDTDKFYKISLQYGDKTAVMKFKTLDDPTFTTTFIATLQEVIVLKDPFLLQDPLPVATNTDLVSNLKTIQDKLKTYFKDKNEKENVYLIDFPLKKWVATSDFKNKNRNRILVIDAKADKYLNGDETGLYKFDNIKDSNNSKNKSKSNGGEPTFSTNTPKLVNAEALPIERYLTVVIKNYNFHDLELFAINFDGVTYSYEQDIKKIYDLSVNKTEVVDAGEAFAGEATKAINDTSDPDVVHYLEQINGILDSYTFMNLNDLYQVEKYKVSLLQFYEKNKDTLFGINAKLLMQRIISWYPVNLSLTPISVDVPDNDEVNISYLMKNKNETAENKSLGNFKTFNGVSVDYGAAFYKTNLRNNPVYKKTTTENNIPTTKAVLADSNDESIGFGLNIDVSYRTGIHLRPTFNFGFFIPIEEEVSPFIATGPGIGFYSKNYKINLSYGLALGKVNSIKEEYKDINLEGMDLENVDLTEKSLQTGQYISLSVSFNLFNTPKK